MNGACLSLFYYATMNCNDKNYKPKLYKGSCEASFKKRYSNRKKSCNIQKLPESSPSVVTRISMDLKHYRQA